MIKSISRGLAVATVTGTFGLPTPVNSVDHIVYDTMYNKALWNLSAAKDVIKESHRSWRWLRVTSRGGRDVCNKTPIH